MADRFFVPLPRFLASETRPRTKVLRKLIKASQETTSYNKRRACQSTIMALASGTPARRVRQIYAAYMYGDNHPIALR